MVVKYDVAQTRVPICTEISLSRAATLHTQCIDPDELVCLPEAAQCLYEIAFAHIMLNISQVIAGLEQTEDSLCLKH